MLMILPVFWTHSARGFVDLFYSVGLAMERPHKIYQGGLKLLFTVIVPLGLVASMPAQIFFEDFNLMTVTHLASVTIGIWLVMLFVWKLGLKSYASASS